MSLMTIGEVAEKASIRASALRYYERIGLLPEPRRVSGQRRYTDDVLIRLAGIQVGKRAGFTIEEIKQLFHGFRDDAAPSERWAALAQEKLVEIDELIRRAQAMKRLIEEGVRCGCSSLEECSVINR